MQKAPQPNVIFVFADQWRAAATGFAGDPNVKTPHLDALAAQSLNFTTAVSGCPVCCPARASLLTGQYPHTHGVFLNDVGLGRGAVSLADAFNAAGYQTGYIGKWHVDGHGRSGYIPPERRQGFAFWRTMECNHHYNNGHYYADDPVKRPWEGYEPFPQTREAQAYIQRHAGQGPFALVLSYGPPHDPYDTAPPRYRAMYDPAKLILRPNVPLSHEPASRVDLAGYYAHCTALDDMLAQLLATVQQCGIEQDTIFVFWSDHGDMLGSQGQPWKQRPWDESILVPLLVRYPRLFGRSGRPIDAPINTPDLLPTLLGLAGLTPPATAQGRDYTPYLMGQSAPPADAALIACYAPFGQFALGQGREYRGVRTRRHTYVRDLNGPWLLYDNQRDPYQLENLVAAPAAAGLRAELDEKLRQLLAELDDRFEPGEAYVRRWGYATDKTGTVPYTN